MNLHAIEPPQLRRQRRVDGVESPRHRADTVTGTTSRLDGVGRLRFDFHTASNSRWCRFFSSIFSYFSFRLPPAMVAAMVARARLPKRLPFHTRASCTASGSRASARSGATISRSVGQALDGPRPQPPGKCGLPRWAKLPLVGCPPASGPMPLLCCHYDSSDRLGRP